MSWTLPITLPVRTAGWLLGLLIPAPSVPPAEKHAAMHFYRSGEDPPDLLVALVRQQVRLYG